MINITDSFLLLFWSMQVTSPILTFEKYDVNGMYLKSLFKVNRQNNLTYPSLVFWIHTL